MANNGSGGGLEELLKFLALMQTVSGLAGGAESTISTTEAIRERARVARETAGNLLLAALGILAGLAGHAWGWLYRAGLAGREGVLTVTGVGLLVYLVLVGGLAMGLHRRWRIGLLEGYLWALALTWVMGFGLLVVLAPVEHEWGLGVAALGLGLALVAMPFFYNQWRDLVDPYWRQSPYERAIQTNLFPAIRELALNGDQGEQVVRRELEVRTPRGEFLTDSSSTGLDEERLLRFAHELVRAGFDLAEARWGDSAVFRSYPEYRHLRSVWEEQGHVRKRNPGQANSAYEMTRGGREMVEDLAAEYGRLGAHTYTHTHQG